MTETRELAEVRRATRKLTRARARVREAEAERDQAVAAARAAGHRPGKIREAARLSEAGARIAANRGGWRE
jgi:hypothetical protein